MRSPVVTSPPAERRRGPQRRLVVGRRLHLPARGDKLGTAERGSLTWKQEPFLEQELAVSI
jgi:hypothetical protein